MPRMNYGINGKKHRFVYGNCVEESALAKQVTFPTVFHLASAKQNWWEHPSLWFQVLFAKRGPKLADSGRSEILNAGLLGNRLFLAALFLQRWEAHCRTENYHLARQKVGNTLLKCELRIAPTKIKPLHGSGWNTHMSFPLGTLVHHSTKNNGKKQ